MLPCKRDAPDQEQEIETSKRRKLRGCRSSRQRGACEQQSNQRDPDDAGDRLSPLSDELLLRILSYLSVQQLLRIGPVSRRLYHLSEDSQLWREHYCLRFVLPRALRIPGFRIDPSQCNRRFSRAFLRRDEHREIYISRRIQSSNTGCEPTAVDWKRQYKLRHNWSLGKCAVEELTVSELDVGSRAVSGPDMHRKTLVKVADGLAVTADSANGLRVWDLKSKALVTQIGLRSDVESALPTCMTLGGQGSPAEGLEIAIGFLAGNFGVWRLDMRSKALTLRYRHQNSTNKALVGIAYYYPYIMTATESVLVSLYTFRSKIKRAATVRTAASEGVVGTRDSESEIENPYESTTVKAPDSDSDWAPTKSAFSTKPARAPRGGTSETETGTMLSPPHLLSSLTSHSATTPLALSIRKASMSFIASIAHTLPTRNGWSLGLQDIHLRPDPTGCTADDEICSSRLAHSLPFTTGGTRTRNAAGVRIPSDETGPRSTGSQGPISICYTHPYLLTTLPDNTLVLHLCTSNATALSISTGVRLWGHTSGVSDAEITSRGKAVSVSCRGDEVRVWELEGRTDRCSVEVRPTTQSRAQHGKGILERFQRGMERDVDSDGEHSRPENLAKAWRSDEWGARRNWVGFDDEMVIILKKSKLGKESLLVYDFS
jgi:hypothetical protein